jgi:rSAM/selenodomain-associated transferase 1
MNRMSHSFLILDPSRPSAEFAGKCALAVMAKAPRPGKVKTRLSPPLTPEQAAELNACFLRDTVASLREATQGSSSEWVISYTPQGEEATFTGILPDGTLLLPQRGGDFGERLLHTAEDLFACGFSAVCLIDSDSPTVPANEFVTAANLLLTAEKQVVIGPSEDGGYYLIGLQTADSRLFEDIAWSTEFVTEQTVARAAEIDLRVRLLQQWYDVDDAASLANLQSEILNATGDIPQGHPATHTREYLSQLSLLETILVAETAV